MSHLLITSSPAEFTAFADEVITSTRTRRAVLTASPSLLEDLDELGAQIEDARRLARAITQMHPDPAMRAAGEAAEQALDKVITELSLDEGIYELVTAVEVSGLDATTRHWVTRMVRDFRRAGVDLPAPARDNVRRLREELVEISQEFNRNINADTRTIAVPPEALDGLPADYVAAHPAQEDGLVRITTDYSDFYAFMSYSHSAQAREQLWREFNNRANPSNVETLPRLLARRHELANLLGYQTWAHYVTEDKMIGNPGNAADFIARISAAAHDRMLADYADLRAQKGTGDDVHPWEVLYLTERLRADRFGFDSQSMRPYFEYNRVKAGLMEVAGSLFGIAFEPRQDIPVWHDSVDVFDVIENGELLGRIFLDMHPRKDKFSHAAMYNLQQGKAGRRIPECVLLCNFPGPGELLQHSEVNTFFHEFGHLLHHIFAGHQPWSGIAGIRTEWDFAEAPSQLLEEWTEDPATLARFGVHITDGTTIPAELVEKMRAAEECGKGLYVRQQMTYADLSLSLFSADPSSLDPQRLELSTRAKHLPYPAVDGISMHLSFGHLDGYSAIYYTYMWSLVIAKDLFTAFDPNDLLARPVADRYREKVIGAGGSAPAAELVKAFLGRPFSFDAYQAWLDR